MRAWSRGERIGFFSLLVAVATCAAVLLSAPAAQRLLFGGADDAEGFDSGGRSASAAAAESQALIDEQRKLLEEQTAAVRDEMRRLHDERMELWKERMERAAERFAGPPPELDSISLRSGCHFDVAVAVSYLALDDTWVTRGWWTVSPGQTVETDIRTRNGKVYFYAENTAMGWTWNAPPGAPSLELAIVNEKFDHRHGERFVYSEPRTVSFFRRDTGEAWVDHVETFACAVEAPPPG